MKEKRKHSIKKGWALLAVLLFIGIVFAPSINASLHNQNSTKYGGVNSFDENENFNCLIIGKADSVYFSGRIFPSFISPIIINKSITFGYSLWEFGFAHRVPSEGRVWSNGANGIIEWEGEFYGQLSAINVPCFIPMVDYQYEGVRGFTGIKIHTLQGVFFMGYASHVKLGPHPL